MTGLASGKADRKSHLEDHRFDLILEEEDPAEDGRDGSRSREDTDVVRGCAMLLLPYPPAMVLVRVPLRPETVGQA